MTNQSGSDLQESLLDWEESREKSTVQPFSSYRGLNRLLGTVVEEVRLYAEDQISHIKRLAQIGISLSAEKNIGRLLEAIVDEARSLTRADAGTLYTVKCADGTLNFEILQNDSMNVRLGGTSGLPVDLPPIPLEKDGKPNYGNVSSYVALTGETAGFADVYESEVFDFTGPKEYDAKTGYRSKSMIVIPMKNHENTIIGVLQLLNAKDPDTGEIVAFPDDTIDLVASLASQAAVALTNAQLIQDLKNLLYAFIKSIATAIDAKSPYTGGHIRRVVELSLMIARVIDGADEGRFSSVHFDEDQLEELRMAAWMHDVGKITTPEHVVDKRTKLEGVVDGIHIVNARFDLIRQTLIADRLRRKLDDPDGGGGGPAVDSLDEELERELKYLEEAREFVRKCNGSGEFMSNDKLERLNDIAAKTYELDGERRPYLTLDEVHSLSIQKGNLTEDERRVIENHAAMTMNILQELPFPKKLARVPKFAAYHHERLDGSGYPFGLKEEELPLQSRILAIADVFEALTAKDRPYKQPMKLSQAVKILGFMKKDRHIDPDIFDLFVGSGTHVQYARMELSPEQIDET